MNVEIGTVHAQFPEKENINGIFVAVWRQDFSSFDAEEFNLRSFNLSPGLGLPPSLPSHCPLCIATRIIGCYCLLVRTEFPLTHWFIQY
jgi:hypothetical protein